MGTESTGIQAVTRKSREALHYGACETLQSLGSALECVPFKATTVLPILALQNLSCSSKNKDQVACLDRRLPLQLEGNFSELLAAGRMIQSRLSMPPSRIKKKTSDPARAFAKKMFQKKTKATLDLLKRTKRRVVCCKLMIRY